MEPMAVKTCETKTVGTPALSPPPARKTSEETLCWAMRWNTFSRNTASHAMPPPLPYIIRKELL